MNTQTIDETLADVVASGAEIGQELKPLVLAARRQEADARRYRVALRWLSDLYRSDSRGYGALPDGWPTHADNTPLSQAEIVDAALTN